MKRLSTDGIWFVKNLLTPVWFAGVAWMAYQAAFGAAAERGVLVPLGLLAVAGAWIALRNRPVADSVDDAGDMLVVRRGRIEERIDLRSIREVKYLGGVRPRVVLSTETPSRFGAKIVFVPHNAMPFSGETASVRQLRERVARAHACAQEATA